jgi:acetyl esterase/lipase
VLGVAAILVGLFLLGSRAGAEDEPPYLQRQDLVYAEKDGAGLLLDLFAPRGKANGLAVVDVASGAWYSDRGKIRDHMRAKMFDTYCGRGYTVVAVRPGSRPRYTALEMVRHVQLGIQYTKQHAAEWKIDPRRLGLTGASAGGHLALLAALTPRDGEPGAADPTLRHDSRVNGVAVFFPPTDLHDWRGDGSPGTPPALGSLLFPGGTAGRSPEELRDAAKAASPLHQVAKTEVPFLLIHGDADPLVPLAHSQRFVEAMKKAGSAAELIVKAGGAHPWPTISEEVRVMADWFDRKFGASAP